MYIPKNNLITDKGDIIAFMQQFSFGTIITSQDNFPVATHLPFLVSERDGDIILTSHFAKANNHWKGAESNNVLTIFTEPHAYISPKHYDSKLNVPTWDYVAVHTYGTGKLITEDTAVYKLLENTIATYEKEYMHQWEKLPQEYKSKMIKGIVAFEIRVDNIEAKEKLSQSKTEAERTRIINSLAKSDNTNEKLISEYMKKNTPIK